MSLFNLEQSNRIANLRGVILDLVLSTSAELVVSEDNDPLVPIDSHHPSLSIDLSLQHYELKRTPVFQPNFRRSNLLDIDLELRDQDFERIDLRADTNTLFDEFCSTVSKIVLRHTPMKNIAKSSFPVWFTPCLRRLVTKKKILHKAYKMSLTDDDYQRFSRVRAECKRVSAVCYRNYLQSVQANIPSNPKLFWSFVRNLKATDSHPRSFMLNDKSSENPDLISNFFADFFSSVYTDNQNCDLPPDTSTASTFSSCSLHLGEVLDCLRNLDISKGCGSDNIPPNVLRASGDVLAPVILILFNHSLASGVFPDVLKRSFIVPIHKSGPATDVRNYRPIAILTTLSKIFETLILKRLSFVIKPSLSTLQHGFTSGRSITTNLLVLQSDILHAFGDRLQVDAIYLDFAKAFDRVNHPLLLAKLSGFGVSGVMLSWFRSYLASRPAQVRFLGSLSREFSPTSGVPQGSHLGPHLFNMFINDLTTHVNTPCLLFADDLKLYRAIRDSDDCLHLQDSLDAVQGWCISNCMDLNINKCSVISFSRKKSPFNFHYRLAGSELARVDEVRDLGVILTSALTWESQIYACARKSLKALGFILRTSKPLNDIYSLKCLFYAFVMPHLEFGCMIWSPHQDYLRAELQMVMDRFLRVVGTRLGFAYREVPLHDVASFLRLLPLVSRREVLDVMFVYKLINAQIDCPRLLESLNFRAARSTRSQDLFAREHHGTSYRLFSPLPRAQRLSDALPASIDFFSMSPDVFKRSLLELKWGCGGVRG